LPFVTYLFVELDECGFELLGNIASEMVLIYALTETLALLLFASSRKSLRAAGQGVQWHRHVLSVLDLL
jgi:hypothetical protein